MKKLLIAMIIVGLLPVAALAQPPSGAIEVDSWAYLEINDSPPETAWVWQSGPGTPNLQALARCFVSRKGDGYCNKDWEIPFKVHASIAQWLEWDFNGTRWDWFVRKPGNYAANCLTWWLSSNQDVTMDFVDFGPLIAEDPKPGTDHEIEVFYCFDPPGALPPFKWDPLWIPAPLMNDPANWLYIEDSENLHEGFQVKIWNYIHVERCNSACEYQNDAFISLTLECQKDWIDRSDGYFNF